MPPLFESGKGGFHWSSQHLDLGDINPSVGSVGDAYDIALTETVNGLFEAESIRTTVFHPGRYRTLADVGYATVDWCDNRRLHGTLGMLTPVVFETLHCQALNRESEPAK